MQWVSHGALLNTAVHWSCWTINIWIMANVLWGRRFFISVNTKGLLKWLNDFSFTSGVPKVMKLENTEVENQDIIFLLFKQWEFILKYLYDLRGVTTTELRRLKKISLKYLPQRVMRFFLDCKKWWANLKRSRGLDTSPEQLMPC